MTNTEDTNPSADLAAAFPELADLSGLAPQLSEDGKYEIVVAIFDGVYARPELAFRTLRDFRRLTKSRGRIRLYLFTLSSDRLDSLADLVRNGLLSQRNYVAGSRKGTSSIALTKLGEQRYQEACVAAAAFLVHPKED